MERKWSKNRAEMEQVFLKTMKTAHSYQHHANTEKGSNVKTQQGGGGGGGENFSVKRGGGGLGGCVEVGG